MANVNTQTLLLVFVAFTGAAVLLQAFVLLALYITVRKTVKTVQEEAAEFRALALPLLTDTKEFLARVGPKIDSVVTDMAELAQGLRAQGAELQTSAIEILERTRRQSLRLDTMLTGVLDTFDRAGAIVTDALNVPLRQLSALAAFARAAVSAFRSGPPRGQPQPTHSPADKDLFV